MNNNIKSNSSPPIDNWIAFDLEWGQENEPLSNNTASTSGISGISGPAVQDHHRILTLGYEDNYGNKGVLDISDFSNYLNPTRAFIEAIKKKLLNYKYCIAWGSKAIKYKNEQNGRLEGINGDLVMLDLNFKHNGIPSMVKYDKFSGIPYIKSIGGST